ncbi:hypothetical protein PLESTF_001632700 [Pleodorina starrii]|nr:hypothetical protein PLESTF_001632700 [Pleodorina starrii]
MRSFEGSGVGGVKDCRTGRDLAAAFADAACSTARLLEDIALRDDDWSEVGVVLPIPLKRNFTVTSADGAWRLLNINYVSGKARTMSYVRAAAPKPTSNVRLLNGAVLRLLHISLSNIRRRPTNISPGLDILAPSPSPGSTLLMQGGLLLLRK